MPAGAGTVLRWIHRRAGTPRCELPVWKGLDNPPPQSSRPIRTVLCGLSLGPRAAAILQWSANGAKKLKAGHAVIHASKALEPNPGLPCDHEWRCWFKRIARSGIQELQEGLGTDADIWLEPGKPLRAIPILAEQIRADLLVIRKSPEKRILGDLRTLSSEIACRTPCPVASV